MFTLQKVHRSGGRLGKLRTKHGVIHTPFFMPIASKGAVKAVDQESLGALQKAQAGTSRDLPILLANTYHLYLTPGLVTLKKAGGLHRFINWPGLILTDSGGFQVFSLASLRKLSNDGAEFHSHLDGSKHFLTPEKSMQIQQVIDADIWMVLDYFPGYPAKREQAQHSVETTTRWAARCSQWCKKKQIKNHLLFGIVQGATYADLRRQSAVEITALDFDGYAIGGLAVGEPIEEMYKMVEATVPSLPSAAPRYLMGVGRPEQILQAVVRGVDMFDCVIPSRHARHGTVFVQNQAHLVSTTMRRVQYEDINLRGAKFKNDFKPISKFCSCITCRGGYTRAYLRHLFAINDPLAQHLAVVHNLFFYMQLMAEIRVALAK